MYKLKQWITGAFISIMLLLTPATATELNIHGTVVLPSSITDLLDGSCVSSDCPSVNISMVKRIDDYMGSSWSSSVYYNEENAAYEYNLIFTDDITDGSNVFAYEVHIYIHNGNIGNEFLYYSFGTDNAIGTTGDASTEDVLLHEDESRDDNYVSLIKALHIPSTQLNTTIDLDLSNKDVGRRIIKGQVKLPEGTTLGSVYDETGTYISYNFINIYMNSPPDYRDYYYTNLNETPDATTGLHNFVISLKDTGNDLNLTLSMYGEISAGNINASYQIGNDATDVDDHSIDGDENLVTGYSDTFVTFTSTDADFGIIDVDAYLVGAKTLNLSVIPPQSYPIYSNLEGYSSIGIQLNSYDYQGYSYYAYFSISEYETPNSDGSYPFKALIPLDIQSKMEVNNLSVRFDFYEYGFTTGVYNNQVAYYTFGDDQAVGGVDTDHILEGVCIDQNDAQPLNIDFSSPLPLLDIDIYNYVLPQGSKVEITLSIPSSVNYSSMRANNLSCENPTSIYGNSYRNNDTTTFVFNNLTAGVEYGFNVSYETGSWEDDSWQWFNYVLDDNDGDFTNGGTFLSPEEWDSTTGSTIYNTTYTATSEDVLFSPFQFIVPTEETTSPAIIMYLLN